MRLRGLSERHRKALEIFLSNVKASYEDVEVYLVGSLARGDWLIDSDIDVLVVTDKLSNLKPWERASRLRMLAPRDVAFDVTCLTSEEFKRLVRFRMKLRNPDAMVRLL